MADTTGYWPPLPYQPAYDRYQIFDAWYCGDPDRLRDLYSVATRPAYRRRGVDRRGGLFGAIESFFWGRPVPPDERRTRLHAPLAGNIARLSAELLLGTPPSINLADGAPTEAGDRLDEIMNSPAVRAALLDGAELQSALGGVAFTINWDTTLDDQPWIVASGADLILPEFRAGHLAALTLWSEYPDPSSAVVWRHLECHEPGRILHTLWQGTDQQLGDQRPLEARPETAGYANLVDADGAIITGTQRLTAVYIPNAASRDWRRDGTLHDLGRPDLEGQEGMLDALDETWSSWMRDIRLGKSRIIVPDGVLDDRGAFDSDREVYQELNIPQGLLDAGKGGITDQQFAIRVAEHSQTASEIASQLILAAGYSLADLDQYTSGAAATATEVTDRRSQSERTRDRKSLRWQAGLASLAQAIMEVDAAVYPGQGGQPIDRPTVTFADTATPDPQQVAQTLSFLHTADLVSQETGVRMAHPDWTDQQVDDELARLHDEAPVEPATFGRVDQPDADEAQQDEQLTDGEAAA